MEEFERIKNYVQSKDYVSVPQIQKHFNLRYSKARETVDLLVEKGILTLEDDLNFRVKEVRKASAPRRRYERSGVRARTYGYFEELVSKEVQYKIDNDCNDEKYAEFIEESKNDVDGKITLTCRKNNTVYSKMIEDFNRLPASSQLILKDAITKSPGLMRYRLYLQLREVGESYAKNSEEYLSHSAALSFLLTTSDVAFERLKKLLKII